MTIKKFAPFGAGLLALGVWGTSAPAQQPAPSNPPAEHETREIPRRVENGLEDLQDAGRMVFKLADENNDGQISQKEAVDAGNLLVGGFFFRADKNGDGVLSQEESRDAREAFFASKPWLRYAIETAKASKPANSSNGNLLATVASSFDTNGDKQLQATELRNAVQIAVETAFQQTDANHDGQVSPAELNAAMASTGRQIAQMSFQQADLDHNGQISEAELEKAVIEPTRVAFKILDLNHDGQISPEEARTARQVVMQSLRNLNIAEPANSPRHQIEGAIRNAPVQPVANTAPAPAPAR
jgi:Ca2+-binding EF-hand superfamily protein